MKVFSATKSSLRILPFLVRNWWLVISIMVFLPAVITSLHDGYKEGDLKQPMKDLGVLLVSSDEVIYDKISDLEFENDSPEGMWELFKFYSGLVWFIFRNFWREIWMMFFVFMFFYKSFVFFGGESLKGVRGVLLAILAMAFVQIMVQGIPFKGTWSLLKFVYEVMVV